MSVALVVIRGGGDKQGPDIVDHLITTVPVALARGRVEVEEQGSNLQAVTMETVYRSGVALGQLIEVIDSFQGEVWYGKLVGLRHVASGGQLLSQLTVRRPKL